MSKKIPSFFFRELQRIAVLLLIYNLIRSEAHGSSL